LAAGLAVGVWKSPEDLRNSWKLEREFKPRMDASLRDQLRKKWARGVRQVQTQ
jgi:glycerol kinase